MASADLIKEPILVFGENSTHIDPKAGLSMYGPAGPPGGPQTPTSITVGIVSPPETSEVSRRWLESLNSVYDPMKENVRAYPPFPGMPKAFNCRIVIPESFVYEIPAKSLEKVLRISSHKKRIIALSGLYTDGLITLREKTGKPTIVVYPWSDEIIEKCGGNVSKQRLPKDVKQLRDKLIRQEESGQMRLMPLQSEMVDLVEKSRSNWNLHSQLKLDAFPEHTPIQIIEPRTFLGKSQLEDSNTLWNISTALYYKAGGIPWRPHEPQIGTCYIGIAFFYDKTSEKKNMRTCMAQIFSDNGQSLVFRGGQILPAKNDRSPRMDQQSMTQLIEDALSLYNRHNKHPPGRVVVHKSSHFTYEEKLGAKNALSDLDSFDLVTINPNSNFQLVRRGTKSPLRGTYIPLEKDSFLLYTSGYVPYLKFYPGPRVPKPILVVHHAGRTDLQKIAKEIMKLTRLNWNSANFSTSMPSTLSYSFLVKEVLSHATADQEVSEDYSSYM